MLNKAILMGRLTRDPELRYTQSNLPVTSFTVAVDRGTNKNTGEKLTDFVPVVAWRSTAEFISKYFGKGMMIIVDGAIQTRRYTDKDGHDRTAIEVVAASVQFGETKRAREASEGGGYRPMGSGNSAPTQYNTPHTNFNDGFDEIDEGEDPF